MPIEDAEFEAVIWCPRCKTPKYEIRRVPAASEGVYRHEPYPPGKKPKRCECGTNLERKP